MSLAPSTDFGIRGEPGKQYPLNETCSAPGCFLAAVHGHHLWARSYLRGQPYEWVRLPNGTVIGNRTGLCVMHHNQVTGEVGGHRAWIAFTGGLFLWHGKGRGTTVAEWIPIGYLDPQPPGVEAKPEERTPEVDSDEVCPKCGHHKKPRKPAPKRKSKTWTLDVPDDAEIGTEILDEWVDSLALILGFDDERSRLRRYHALAAGLAWIHQHQEHFAVDVVEAARA